MAPRKKSSDKKLENAQRKNNAWDQMTDDEKNSFREKRSQYMQKRRYKMFQFYDFICLTHLSNSSQI